jgi:hypothetical protein
MSTAKRRGRRGLPVCLGLAASLWLVAGCALCTKHLYLFRETPQKLPASETALLVADPDLLRAAMPDAAPDLQGAVWAPEQPFYPTEMYRLTILDLDGQKVYQGMCLDTLPTYAVEVRPGARRVGVRVDLFGPSGQQKFSEVLAMNLEPGRVYFLSPDWQQLLDKRLALKVQRLPQPYTPEVRARIIQQRRQTGTGASLD